MAFFDQRTNIFHGMEVPRVYDRCASLGQVLLFNFFKSPEKIVQVSADDGVQISCAEMSRMMTNIAQNLFRLGFRFGDSAGLFATNTTFAVPAMFACYLLGISLNPLDVSFSVSQIVQVYRETKPKLVFCDHDMVDKLIMALEIMASDARIVILTDKLDGFLHITDLFNALEEPIEL